MTGATVDWTTLAGRELDALVCQTFGVLGRVEFYACAPGSENAGWFFDERRSEVARLIDDANKRGSRDWRYGSQVKEVTHYPRVSVDMGAAWLVVEAMDRRGFHARIKSPFEPGAQCFAGFTPHGMSGWNGRPDFEAGAETPALAICLAALKTVNP